MDRLPIRNTFGLAICASMIALLPVCAYAEPVTTSSAVNLRSGAGTASSIAGKIPAGSLVQVSHCSDWCEVEWQGQKGFVIATALNRRGQASAQHSPGPANAAADNPVPMSLPKVDEGPQRYQGPYIGGAGPGRGFGWLGYRGRW